MTTTKFRIILIINLASSYVGEAIVLLGIALYPKELSDLMTRDYAAHSTLYAWLWVVSTLLMLVHLVSLIGLFFLKRWARYTYTMFVAIWFILLLQPGLSCSYTWTGILPAVALISCGVILSVVICPPRNDFFSSQLKRQPAAAPYA